MEKLVFLFLVCLGLNAFSQQISVEAVERVPRAKVVVKAAGASVGGKSNSAAKAAVGVVAHKVVMNPDVPSAFFIVQNIATEKLRVYRRCTQSTSCAHQLVFETDMLVGQKTAGQQDPIVYSTRLGHFKIAQWNKFYEDAAKKFPAWYKADYPIVPRGASASDWLDGKYLPNPQVNKYRGAYGWFTAQLGPNIDGQVIHGTYGWANDNDLYISRFRNPFVKYIDDPMAVGATRLENQAIAYLRHIADVGTDVFRVYALEAYADQSLARYSAYKNAKPRWDWVLTSKDAQKDNSSIDKSVQVRKNYVHSDILEEGTFEMDCHPDGIGFSYTLFGLNASSGTSGNTYQIKKNAFKGVFLLDEGRFFEYQHPHAEGLFVGGFPKGVLPGYVQTTQRAFVLAAPMTTPRNGQ